MDHRAAAEGSQKGAEGNCGEMHHVHEHSHTYQGMKNPYMKA